MISISISELRRKFGSTLDQVASGRVIVVTRRGHQEGKLIPVGKTPDRAKKSSDHDKEHK